MRHGARDQGHHAHLRRLPDRHGTVRRAHSAPDEEPGSQAQAGGLRGRPMSDTMDIGVFIPIGNNGWLISTSSPQYKPTFELNKQIVQRAEDYGFDFALSMIKLH